MIKQLTPQEFKALDGLCPICKTALERTSARTVIRNGNGNAPDAPTRLVLKSEFVCMANLRKEKRCENADRYVVETQLEFDSE